METTKLAEKSEHQGKKPIGTPGKRKLITSALPYVNNVPHLGNIIGSVLSADVFSRYLKLRGEEVLFICGTDEYGTATETKAVQEGLTPREICDKYNKIHKQVYDWFDIKFDSFGRTSEPEQTEITQKIFLDIHKNDYILEKSMEQLYCEKCQKFLADRFVEGTCPKCNYTDARGDQCDSCSNMLNAVELVNPRCKLDNTRPVIRSTTHLFLDLPKLTPALGQWIQQASIEGSWSPNSVQVTNGWLKQGLEPRCITRDLKWGVPVPLEQYKDKVFYVWFDAPIGYISITAKHTDQWESWWKDPKNVELYQFMGKDNIPFHTLVFPSALLATHQEWTKLHHVSTTEYLNYEGGKFSKSRNTGVFGLDCIDTGIPSEVWRYYLLSNRPENQDSSFSWDDLQLKNNTELIATLGNFVNRAISFTHKNLGAKVPSHQLSDKDNELIKQVNEVLNNYLLAMEHISLKEGLKEVMKIARLGNGYLQENAPWDLIKTDVPRCNTVLSVALNLTLLLAQLLEPFMPAFSLKVRHQLQKEYNRIPNRFEMVLEPGHVISAPAPIFKNIDDPQVVGFKSKYGAAAPPQEGFPLDIRGAVIRSVSLHPADNQLYLVQLDFGTVKRQAVARLVKFYPEADQLVGRQVVTLCNLPPTHIKEQLTECMILVAESKTKTGLLQPSQATADSEWLNKEVTAKGTSLTPQDSITLKEFQKLRLTLNKEGNAQFKEFPLIVGDISISADGVTGPAKVK